MCLVFRGKVGIQRGETATRGGGGNESVPWNRRLRETVFFLRALHPPRKGGSRVRRVCSQKGIRFLRRADAKTKEKRRQMARQNGKSSVSILRE